MNTRNYRWLGLWAIPNEEQSSEVNDIKNRINQRLNGPYFPLHITLTGSFGLSYEELYDSMPKILSSLRPLKINYKDYFLDEYLFEAFYVKVILSEELKRMRSELCKILSTNDGKFNPHMSLYYGEESRLKKSMILSDLPPLEGEFNIDCLNIVSFNTLNFTTEILDRIVLE